MPLQATSGAASYDAFGGGVAAVPNYIEDVFSTFLFSGTGSGQTINNGIDLSGKGGLVWLKGRNLSYGHNLFDTVRGSQWMLSTDNTNAQGNTGGRLSSFNSNGFSISNTPWSDSGLTAVSWSFREQPKFFDIVTWTGDDTQRSIPHSLGSTPGMVIIKPYSGDLGATNWYVWHKDIPSTRGIFLNLGDQARDWDSGQSLISVDANNINILRNSDFISATSQAAYVNTSRPGGQLYIAYVFAHNAGGFGLTGTDNVISCGSYTGNGSSTFIDLGYEPQWILIKASSSNAYNWVVLDNMRGLSGGSNGTPRLFPNTSGAETGGNELGSLNATGFTVSGGNSNINGVTYIYIAIRRGPMRTPTTGTSVFDPEVATDTEGQGVVKTTNFPVDLQITKSRASSGQNFTVDRLRGVSTTATDTGPSVLITNSTGAQSSGTFAITRAWNNTGFQISSAIGNSSQVYWNFRRAPGYFDSVCYTGNGVGYGTYQSIQHNLTVVPELIIVKNRSNVIDWVVYAQPIWNGATDGTVLVLNTNASMGTVWSNQSFGAGNNPTATDFKVGWTNNPADPVNGSGQTYVAYLFASCPGVQYINSYVGDGTTGRTINCGFTGGARFVCIKATSTTGSWWTFDSARGIVTNNDPALQLNSTAAEVTSADAIDTASSGFIVNQESTCSLNASGVTYLVWAIA